MIKKKRKRKIRRKRRIPIRQNKELTYSIAEMEAIQDYIEKTYGPIEAIFHDPNPNVLHVDLCVVAPDEERPYWKIITMGMGKYKMYPSSEQIIMNPYVDRCELVMAIEPAWDYSNLFPMDSPIKPSKPIGYSTRSYSFPIQVLANIAHIPILEKLLLVAPMTTELPGIEFDVKTDLDEFLLLHAQDVQPGEEIATLPNGDDVVFYQVVPITLKERLALSNPEHFEEVINKITYVFYPERESTIQ